MGDGDGGGGLFWPTLIVGAIGLGYVYRNELGLAPQYAAIEAWIRERLNLPGGGGGGGGCTKTCTGATHLDPIGCQCVANSCTKTCTLPEVLDAVTCTCAVPTCNKTCTAPLVLNNATCQCESAGGGGGGGAGGNITFTAAGDWGSGRSGNPWDATVATMASQHPQVVLIPGDMSYTDVAGFKKVTDGLKAIPAEVFGAQGNHDSGSYSSLFNAFSNFVKTVGNVSFMGLNTESGSSSVTYARANLSKMTGKFKVVFFHKPIWTVKSDHAPDEGKIKALIPDFEAAHVNMVIGAHNHNYQRFAPVKGVTYLVVGTGGEGAYSIGANCSGCPPIVKTTGSFGCLSVTTSSSSMACKFVQNGGKVFDSWTI